MWGIQKYREIIILLLVKNVRDELKTIIAKATRNTVIFKTTRRIY